MKKLISMLLAVMMLVGVMAVTVHAAAVPTVAVESAELCPGQEVTLEVTIAGNPGITSGKVILTYDKAALELKALTTFKRGNDHIFMGVGNAEEGIANHASADPIEGDGTLFTATFAVKAEAVAGEYEIKATVKDMANGDGDIVPTVVNGKLTVGHKFTNYVAKDAATCEKNATEVATCDNGCGETHEREKANTKLEHKYEVEVAGTRKDATCMATGSVTMKCKTCEATDVVTLQKDPAKHTGNNSVVGAKAETCGADGHTGKTVCECGVTIDEGKDIPATGKHTGGTATCKDKAVCSVCSKAYGDLNASNHAGGTTIKNAKEATCGEAGYTGDTYCVGCNTVIEAGETIPATGKHTGGTATCKDKAVCSVCSKPYGDLNASNHAGGTTIKNAKEATCGEAGYTGDTYCVGCSTKIKDGEAIPATGKHADVTTDKDHKCDVCGAENITEHKSQANSHYCDCGEKMSEHEADGHNCKICGEKLTDHKDENGDNVCDICGGSLACDHKDTNKDHKCDTCGEELSKCADTNKDHKCDTCGKVLSECADKNKDHKCDTCGKELSKCADTNKDHKCDTCGKVLSECADKNKDHKCDTCGKVLSECADTNKDHKCDTCGKVLSECTDANKDGKCDICGAEVVNENIDRIFGAGRVETALEVAKALKETLGVEKFNAIIIANGENDSFADALTGSFLANKKGAPILLYRNSGMSAENMEFIANNLSNNGTVYLLGGTGVIPASVEASLSGYNVKRLAGETRFDTNLAILKEAGVANEEILIARGFDFADSLSASATGLPILVVNEVTSELTEAQITYLKQLKGNKMTIIGGPKIITEKLEAQIEEVIGAEVGRLYGDMREDTSVMIAEKYIEAPDFAVIAYSRTSPDGLCGGPLAYAKGAPLLLTNVGQESKAAAYIAKAGIDEGYVLGGTAIVSDSSVKQIFGLADNAVINTK